MSSEFQRLHLRSPLVGDVLYEADGHVHLARSVNISEGGILLENLPIIPEINAMPVMFTLPQYPNFSQTNQDVLKTLKLSSLEKKILRSRARLVRSFEGQSEVEKIFVTKIGCEFVLPSTENKALVAQYVVDFASNILFLLGLFQRSSQIELLRNVAELLGYDSEEKLPILRSRVLHDYQSLESL